MGTVEDFWGVYNWIVLPSQLQIGSSYGLFKAGVRPDWEDEANAKGGRWVIQSRRQLDYVWKEIAMTLVGSSLGVGLDDTVAGAVVNARRAKSNIGVWMMDSSLSDKMEVRLRNVLKRSDTIEVWNAEYRSHK